jgi:hypothetical protein
MTDNDPAGSTSPTEVPGSWPQQEPSTPEQEPTTPAEDPGYLTETGQAAAEDGSVVPIIGGLPAVEGSAWDIGAPLEDRGAGLAEEQGHTDHGDTRNG